MTLVLKSGLLKTLRLPAFGRSLWVLIQCCLACSALGSNMIRFQNAPLKSVLEQYRFLSKVEIVNMVEEPQAHLGFFLYLTNVTPDEACASIEAMLATQGITIDRSEEGKAVIRGRNRKAQGPGHRPIFHVWESGTLSAGAAVTSIGWQEAHGTRYVQTVRRSAALEYPAWNPEEATPQLSIPEVIAVARAKLQEFFSGVAKLELREIHLDKYTGTGRWFYCLGFEASGGPFSASVIPGDNMVRLIVGSNGVIPPILIEERPLDAETKANRVRFVEAFTRHQTRQARETGDDGETPDQVLGGRGDASAK